MIRHGRQFAIVAAGVLSLSACGSNSTEGSSTSTRPVGTTSSVPGTAQPDATAAATDPSSTGTSPTASVPDTAQPDATTAATDPPPTPWSAPLDDCPDEGAATAQITGTLTIGSAQPLSGTPAVAFAPAAAGLQLYLDHANQNNLVDGVTLKVDIRDDQYDPTQTPGVVSALIDSGVDIFAGIVGTPNNEAVRETLNEECIPQLLALTGSPAWGDVANYPWTTGALVPYDIEAKTYASTIKDLYGDGATVGVFSVNPRSTVWVLV
ncbi:MAG: ABC transporter substrate-binding protein [Ilumatobacteraceae bacterium]